eukprot:318606-Lingulodinium_polyedra.AAC.1
MAARDERGNSVLQRNRMHAQPPLNNFPPFSITRCFLTPAPAAPGARRLRATERATPTAKKSKRAH